MELLWSHLSHLHILLPLACVILSLLRSHSVSLLCRFQWDSCSFQCSGKLPSSWSHDSSSNVCLCFRAPFISFYNLLTTPPSMWYLPGHWPIPQTGGCCQQPLLFLTAFVPLAVTVCSEVTMNKAEFKTSDFIVISIPLLLQETYFPCPSATLSRFSCLT